ncbi:MULTISPECIES: hypothetical protein [unclassified Nocardioides]|uniref:hypothetical protein n=1 Tax=unclassified Nocardioides TaxID=2615069 RepID=UPI0006F326C2|nr:MULTISPECIES: hypothetical protein [unclassified Nocardioides]KRA27233.1 hypothetical protein ASD81_24390 [Nocardioides sp. Root614]KRA91109.1 hypothetical protein ASD84_00090 [Nocardioides sp. Root682]
MNTNLTSALSLIVVVALLAVLVGFVRHLTGVLNRTGKNLVDALAVTTTIRQDCEQIVGGVLALNVNLNAAAAGLNAVTSSAQRRAASRTTELRPITHPPTPAQPPATVRTTVSAIRDIRAPKSKIESTPEPARVWTIREPTPNGDAPRGLHVRDGG